jgi:hypothetical protein
MVMRRVTVQAEVVMSVARQMKSVGIGAVRGVTVRTVATCGAHHGHNQEADKS